ncbi:MAG: Tat pathway signal protein, partial [Ginsengibacter sp.]
EKGGSLICTGETSLYNEWGDQRPDYALAQLYGVHFIKGNVINSKSQLTKLSGNAYHTYLRLVPELRSQVEGPVNGKEPAIQGKRHPILKGFEETDILPFGGMLQPLKLDESVEVPMTFIPQFPVYPPETAWMREPNTNIPGIILRVTSAGSRIAFMPADIDTQFARNNLPDHGNLLKNVVRWAVQDDIPLSVEGAGLIDCHLYEQKDRLILHVVNLTSAATWRQPLDELISIGPLKLRVELSKGSGKNIRLNVSGQKVAGKVFEGWVKFEIKSLSDHELAVIS